MLSSAGAVSAAHAGRGDRMTVSNDYQVILPTLPTGSAVLNTVFLHGDVKARPYSMEHFRDALARLALLPEVTALGAYQMNHVWAVTFKSAEGKKRMLNAADFTVKESRCVVVDPTNQDTRLKLHWVLHNVKDDEVRAALAPYGKVTEVTRDKWRVPGCADMESTTRSVSLRLKVGVTAEDLPHQLRVAGDLALVVVPGRAPLCLRCRSTGHIRRECRVPRCTLCRRFGHDESQCVRSYASVAGPVGSDPTADHIMDEVDAEEAAEGGGDGLLADATPPPSEASAKGAGPQRCSEPSSPNAPANEPVDEGANRDTASTPVAATSKGPETMDVGEASASGAVAKRVREPNDDGGSASSVVISDEPPLKTAPVRRSSFKPKPNIPPDRRPPATPSS
ncbi:unnamed protein product [Ixodes persulcatus]